jgi:hypothetical protein
MEAFSADAAGEVGVKLDFGEGFGEGEIRLL